MDGGICTLLSFAQICGSGYTRTLKHLGRRSSSGFSPQTLSQRSLLWFQVGRSKLDESQQFPILMELDESQQALLLVGAPQQDLVLYATWLMEQGHGRAVPKTDTAQHNT